MNVKSKRAKIIVIEDDVTFGESLVRQLRSASYRAELVSRPEQAIENIGNDAYDVAVIDCLLPGMSGVDLGLRIKEGAAGAGTSIVFMSGVYTDKKFVKEAQQTPNTIGFFEKPFDSQELIHLLDTHFQAKSTSPQKRLHDLLSQPKASSREKRRAIEALERVHGFDLPLIFSLLVETKSSGHLNIVNEDGKVSGISFSKGAIVNVDVADEATYIGRLLINHGFIRPIDLESVLSSVNQRKIGERLIQANLLSPHALDSALANQMNIRLSRTIISSSIELNFVPCEVPYKIPNIEADNFRNFLCDWIKSKLTFDWLKSLYHYWGNHKFTEGPAYADREKVLEDMAPSQIVPYLLQGKSLDQILADNEYSPDDILRTVHLLVMKRVIVFKEGERQEDPAAQINALKKFSADMQGKNHIQLFEMLGAGHDQLAESAANCFHEFKNWIQATGDPEDAEVIRLRTSIQARVQEAYNIISNGEALANYRKKMGEDAIQEKLQVQKLVEEGLILLKKSQFKAAYDKLSHAKRVQPTLENIKLYCLWAEIGSSEVAKNRGLQQSIEKEMGSIPPEERYSALFAFVDGLYHKSISNTEVAKKSFEKAIFMDPKMIEPKRELNLLLNKKSKAKKEDILNRDIKDIFTSFFRKSKSG